MIRWRGLYTLPAMKSDARWMAKLACRILVNALIGGTTFAFVGAFCIGATGGLIGTILDYAGMLGAREEGGFGFLGAFVGAKLGFLSGTIGVIILIITTIHAMPGRLLKPFNIIIGRLILGQILGTMGAFTSFMVFELAKTLVMGRGLAQNINDDLTWILLGAPASMICGAIAGALSKRDT